MKIRELFEAKADSAMSKIISYLERSLGAKLIKVPGVEHFKNSKETGWGIRYILDGSTRCIRFNWDSESAAGHSTTITSIDVFDGKHDPSIHIRPEGVSLVKVLPSLAGQLSHPTMGKIKVFASSGKDDEDTTTVSEAKRGDFTPESALSDFLNQLGKGKTLTRSDWIGRYHISTVDAFDTLVKDFPEKIEIQGKRIGAKEGVDLEMLKKAVLANCDGILDVSRGGADEQYLDTPQEEEVEQHEHVSFSDSLQHLEGLVQGLIKGSFNALFVAGKGGTGKTQTVEDTLEAAGLRDGDGYFKNTGSASAIGIYSLLYRHRKDIILFDDSDGALADQDARNLIKAATDTKKVRKLVWNKKMSNMIDPDIEDIDDIPEDDDRIPKYFNFEGRIIFISNLPLDKLDPDKALRTRAFVIAINPTPDELIERMEQLLYKIPLEDGLSLSNKERDKVLDVVKGGKRKTEVSLRTLVRALNLAASGASNWEQLVKLYA